MTVATKGQWIAGFWGAHNQGRFLAAMEGHGGPFYYYALVVPLGCLPWSAFGLPALWSAVRAAGFSISEAGPEVEHRGWRRAYRFHWNAAEAGLAKRSPVVARMFGRRPAYCPASRMFREHPPTSSAEQAQGSRAQPEVAS